MSKIRTRFAPSPTGPLHIGGVRTALYSYLFAKQNHGDFILRIEDTDTARTVRGSEDVINESLQWCGIIPDEGITQGGEYAPYRQSERKDIYKKYAFQLVESGKAYYAFDTEEEIANWRGETATKNNGISKAYNYETREAMNNSLVLPKEIIEEKLSNNIPFVIRLKVNKEDDILFHDLIRGEVKFSSSQLDDRVLLKSDGMPTYHLANVVDDYLMKITHVIRGEEWLASTPHHILLYKSFGWNMPAFAHLPLFLKPDGKGKLSKRDGDRLGFPVFCTQFTNPDTGEITKGFREMGFEKDAFVNFIALLGWNDGTERELFDMQALIDLFSIERVHKAGAKFNFEKAIWFNQQYIRAKPIEELVAYLTPELRKFVPNLSDDFILKYCNVYKDRIDFLYQLIEVGNYMYGEIEQYDKATFDKKWNDDFLPFTKDFIHFISTTSNINDTDYLEVETKKLIEQYKLSMGAIFPILRIALTGTTKGPSIYDTISLLGKESTIRRIEKIIPIS